MSIKFLGAMIMALQLTTSAYGINHKRLELEADTYQHRIWSRVPSDETMVRGSLSFVSKEDSFDPRYTQAESFLKFYKEANDEIKDEGFLGFSDTCKKIFETSDDLHKAAVYILLEKIREKSLHHLNYSNEIDTVSRAHQRELFKYFKEVTFKVCKPLSPPQDCNYWWADSMIAVRATK